MLTYFGKSHRADGPAREIATVQAVRGYWEALRPNGGLPLRSDLDPRGIADCLEKVFLIERIAPGHARFRLAGMHLSEIMGMDVRGMPLTALFEPQARMRVSEELEQVFAAPSILEIWLEAERGIGRGALTGRLLLLPLRETGAAPAQALGCLTCHDRIGRAPRRFAVSGMLRELVAPTRQPPQPVAPRAEVAPPAPAKVIRARPWLRLVSSLDQP